MDISAATTDEIAAIIAARVVARVVAQPARTIACAPGADELVSIMNDRLPYLSADDLGAVLLHIGCWYSDALQIMRGLGGLSAHAASAMATDIVTLAGERLYTAGQQAARDRRGNGPKAGG